MTPTSPVTPDQAEGLVADMLGVEAAVQDAMDRAQRVTRTLATLTASRAVTETPEGLVEAARENADFTDSRGFLGWVHERLAVVYGENPNFDWMLKLDRIATSLAHKEDHGG